MNIPRQIQEHITSSGFLNYDSIYGRKTLKALFQCPENIYYLQYAILAKLSDINFVESTILDLNMNTNVNALYACLAGNIKGIVDVVDVFKYKLPAPEYLSATNPVEQLHYINSNYIVDTARMIIASPDMIMPTYYDYDTYTGATKCNLSQEFGPKAYADGTWHPETLFTDTIHNRNNPYWEPIEITFDPNTFERIPGHRYASPVYDDNDKWSRRKFPGVRHYKRHMDRSDYGLREGGNSDRRVQRPSGYNLQDLYNKPSYVDNSTKYKKMNYHL